MKVLTATTLTNGERDNDFDWCTPGELLMFGTICGRDLRDPDNGCGCGRAFACRRHSPGCTHIGRAQRLWSRIGR